MMKYLLLVAAVFAVGALATEGTLDATAICASYKNCPTCVTNLNCGWCVSDNGAKCIVGNVVGPLCTANCTVSYEYAFCSGEPCGRMYKDCDTCVKDPFCVWSHSGNTCTEGNMMGPIDRSANAKDGKITFSHGHCGTRYECAAEGSAATTTTSEGTTNKEAKVKEFLKDGEIKENVLKENTPSITEPSKVTPKAPSDNDKKDTEAPNDKGLKYDACSGMACGAATLPRLIPNNQVNGGGAQHHHK